jgi:transcription termination/antitermination protein NusG
MSEETRQSADQWYAITTRSRHERVVGQQLAQKNIETFLPTIARWSRWKDRKKRIDWPLFPGYCFAHISEAHLGPVLRCAGVLTIVSFGGKPAVIPDSELDGIRRLVTSALPYDPCPFVQEGMTVEVTNGPLRGVIGRLLRKQVNRVSLVLAVDAIGQGVKIEVDAADVAPR